MTALPIFASVPAGSGRVLRLLATGPPSTAEVLAAHPRHDEEEQ